MPNRSQCSGRLEDVGADLGVVGVELGQRRQPPPGPVPEVPERLVVRSFPDSDGDGNGDLRGLIDRLDYLNDGDPATTDDLGVTGLWLMPVFESPSYHGYDVVDYRTVEQDYGTAARLPRLRSPPRTSGACGVIVDLVMNHTSASTPGSPAPRSERRRTRRLVRLVGHRSGHRGPVGPRPPGIRASDRYYYGLFWAGMPDLNYRQPGRHSRTVRRSPTSGSTTWARTASGSTP